MLDWVAIAEAAIAGILSQLLARQLLLPTHAACAGDQESASSSSSDQKED
jgi:hypothetical protein